MNHQQTKDIIQINLTFCGIRGRVWIGDDNITQIVPAILETMRRGGEGQDIGRRIQLAVLMVQFPNLVVIGDDNRQAAAMFALLLQYDFCRLFQAGNIERVPPRRPQMDAAAHVVASVSFGLGAACGSCEFFEPLRLGKGGTSSRGSSFSLTAASF